MFNPEGEPQNLEEEKEEKTYNIDTTQHAGGDKEKAENWDAFARSHFKEMRVLKEAGLLGKENKDWRNVSEHVLAVSAFAGFLAKMLEKSGQDIDVKLVESAAILHDASKRLDVEKGVRYDSEKKSGHLKAILEKHGYSKDFIKICLSTGRDPAIFLGQEDQDREISSRSLGQLIMAYTDARVRNVDIFSLEEATELNKEKVPQDEEFYDDWYSFHKKIEDYIFERLQGIKPEEIDSKLVSESISGD